MSGQSEAGEMPTGAGRGPDGRPGGGSTSLDTSSDPAHRPQASAARTEPRQATRRRSLAMDLVCCTRSTYRSPGRAPIRKVSAPPSSEPAGRLSSRSGSRTGWAFVPCEPWSTASGRGVRAARARGAARAPGRADREDPPRVRGDAHAFRCHAAFLRPDAEATLNALGATLAQLRDAVERATRDTLRDGDDRFALLPGAGLLTAAHLVNGVHPGDEGHALLARAVAENLTGNKFLGAIFGKALD